jgi:uncharacterized repeat protein (TIGR03803 family)
MRLSNFRFSSAVFAALAILLSLNLTATSQALGASASILWNFGNGTDGSGPGDLIMDANGELFGLTSGGGAYAQTDENGNPLGGTAFELTPPASGAGLWTESVLWNFGNGNDASIPRGPLIMDKDGNLYGTTRYGGPYAADGGDTLIGGTVFKLIPPATLGGAWTESVLWSFGNGTDGDAPSSGVVMDGNGNLYGTTNGGGTNGDGIVFELTPPATAGEPWTESILADFGSGAGVIRDSSGNLYGITGSTVFELSPPASIGGNWTESILWRFGSVPNDGSSPLAGVIMDANGNLYGTTSFGGAYFVATPGDVNPGGTVFELTPPPTTGGNWTESILYSFGEGGDEGDGNYGPVGEVPQAGLITDASGNLYSTTLLGGGVFELEHPSKPGSSWTASLLANIGNGAGVIRDVHGNLYGSAGGGTYGGGVAFEVSTATTLTASPKSLNFGKVDVTTTSKPKRVTLANRGKFPALISGVAVVPPFAFTITSAANTCSGETLAPKKTCSFEVEYTPTTVGEVDGAFAGVFYNGTSPLVALKGIAIAPNVKKP